MAQKDTYLVKDKLCCSVCLDLLKDPVTIPCGHSYCLSCIRTYWDAEGHKGNSCPQCRQAFTRRPALVKNTLLADLVEDLKRTGLQAAPAALCYATHQDVACDSCTGRKLKATKSCLQCLVSYCDQHLQPHYESPAFEKHQLVDPCEKLQENICTRHHEVMKVFCRTDQQCICYLCSMDEHKGHDTVSAAAEVAEKQRVVRAARQKIHQIIQDMEDAVRKLQQKVESINCSADNAVKDSEKIFTDVKQQIRTRQKSELDRVSEVQEKLEQEIAELRRNDTELEQLSHTKDHIQLLNCSTVLSHIGDAMISCSDDMLHLRYTEPEDVTAAVSSARNKLQDVLSKETAKPSQRGTESVQKTKDELLQYLCEITLDHNTAHVCICVDSKTKARYYHLNCVGRVHPDRFTDWYQVLCRENLTGRCYWEVQWTGPEVFIAVAYKSMSRAGRESAFGNNDKSWALQCFHEGYEFRHNSIRHPVKGPHSSTIGVFLDHKAGYLAFYSVSEIRTLLYELKTLFTQPLCPGFGMFDDYVHISTILNSID
ncbi:tripartite motif-containing protein 16-like [Betta splendens]|uniref:Tripartite motif-containing protein 16-like n=1 Tax=Betta splendens TaxID=158456 RepID=A0A6P7P0H0_BETSP|nr:tripartite motif-containing protein 16-like [Betta splendens]